MRCALSEQHNALGSWLDIITFKVFGIQYRVSIKIIIVVIMQYRGDSCTQRAENLP